MLYNQAHEATAAGRRDAAIALYRRVIALSPNLPCAHLGLAEALLQDGQFHEGWREYEWRWHSPAAHRRDFPQPRWNRASPPGGTVLLHAEQGLGDTLQFCRYVPLVARLARVVLEAPAPLLRRLRGLDGVAELVATGDPLPEFDRHCPLLSLPLAFGAGLASIPADTRYLHPVPADVALAAGARRQPMVHIAAAGPAAGIWRLGRRHP